MIDLNHFYLKHKAMYEQDDSWDGFKWICYDDNLQNIVSFRRIDREGEEVVEVVNFAPVVRYDYRIGVAQDAYYVEALNSDDEKYGGSGVHNEGWISAEETPMHGYDYSISITVPPMAAVFFTLRKKRKSTKKTAVKKDKTATDTSEDKSSS